MFLEVTCNQSLFKKQLIGPKFSSCWEMICECYLSTNEIIFLLLIATSSSWNSDYEAFISSQNVLIIYQETCQQLLGKQQVDEFIIPKRLHFMRYLKEKEIEDILMGFLCVCE